MLLRIRVEQQNEEILVSVSLFENVDSSNTLWSNISTVDFLSYSNIHMSHINVIRMSNIYFGYKTCNQHCVVPLIK